ncbi:hypothetical protein, partial [Pseudomonas viridiflava]|uniref:hypothetical protein n=1 Tax=Pseudomonas viridiflava TaxID=33069 RepID=UPI00197B0D9B
MARLSRYQDRQVSLHFFSLEPEPGLSVGWLSLWWCKRHMVITKKRPIGAVFLEGIGYSDLLGSMVILITYGPHVSVRDQSTV